MFINAAGVNGVSDAKGSLLPKRLSCTMEPKCSFVIPKSTHCQMVFCAKSAIIGLKAIVVMIFIHKQFATKSDFAHIVKSHMLMMQKILTGAHHM